MEVNAGAQGDAHEPSFWAKRGGLLRSGVFLKPFRFVHENGLGPYIASTILTMIGILLTYWWVICDPNQPRFIGAGDCWAYYGPALHYMDNRIHHGEFPLWNPLYLCGQPHAANLQSWVFYPPNLVRSLLTFHPTPWRTHAGIAIMIGFHLLLGGMGMVLLGRGHGLSFGASLVGCVAFVFSAAIVTRAIGHWIFLNTACWVPLLLFLMRTAFFRPTWRTRLPFALAGGITLGMAILGGVPNLILLTGLIVAVYGGMLRLLYFESGPVFPKPGPGHGASPSSGKTGLPTRGRPAKRSAKPEASPSARWRGILRRAVGVVARDGVLWGLLFAMAFLVASPLLLPAAEFASFTDRGNKDNIAAEDLAHVAGFWPFLKVLAVYQGHGHYEAPRAAGAGVLFLALAGLALYRRRDVILFAVLFVVLLDCSSSEPLMFGRLINWLAPYKISNPGRSMILTCLPLGLLAGAGTDAVMAPITKLRWKALRSLFLIVLGAAVVSVVAFAPRPEPVLPVGCLVIVLPGLTCLAAVVSGWIRKPAYSAMLIALLVFGETLAWNKQLLPSILPESQQYKGSMELLQQPKEFWSDNHRGTSADGNVPMYELKASINGYDPLEIRRVCDTLCDTDYKDIFRRGVTAAECTRINFRGNTFLKRQFWLVRQFVRGPLPNLHRPIPPTTTVFLDDPGTAAPIPEVERAALPPKGVSEHVRTVTCQPPDAPPLILESEKMHDNRAYELRTLPLPPLHSSIVFTATCPTDVVITPFFKEPQTGRQEFSQLFRVKASEKKARDYEVALPDFAEFQTYLAADFEGRTANCTISAVKILNDLDDEDKLIHIASRTANTVDLDIDELAAPRMLLCVDAYYPGWKAYVDGKQTPIYLADNAFKAVGLSKGSHHVRFVFTSWPVWIGVAISVLTLASGGGMMYSLRRKNGPFA